ncbi:MAG: shikimate dehydrogenase family protein [Actinomycetaceae bacterium]
MTPGQGDRPTTGPGRAAGSPGSVVVVGEDVFAPGVARRAAVLGSPVAHSLSPTLHRAAYAQLGLTDWAYGLQDVTAEQLPAALAGLDTSWAGLSLTMPLKVAAAGAVDLTDPVVKVAGVVNTIVVQSGGLLVGANTDVAGITGALSDAGVRAGSARSALVLGARATASSAVAALGGLGVSEIVFAARSTGGPGSALPVAHRAGLQHFADRHRGRRLGRRRRRLDAPGRRGSPTPRPPPGGTPPLALRHRRRRRGRRGARPRRRRRLDAPGRRGRPGRRRPAGAPGR